MTHLTADPAVNHAPSAPAVVLPWQALTSPSCMASEQPGDRGPNSSSPKANLLEKRSGDFQYSVIPGSAAIIPPRRIVVYQLLNDVSPAAKSGIATVYATEQADQELAFYLARAKWTSNRWKKDNANDCLFVDETQHDRSVAMHNVMLNSENIHATYPPSAANTPIFYKSVLAAPATRGTTPSNGAADADGR